MGKPRPQVEVSNDQGQGRGREDNPPKESLINSVFLESGAKFFGFVALSRHF
jgi:hypothetical protein